MKNNPPAPESPLVSLAVNILLPVAVLNKGAKYMDPKWVLLVALLFPLVYGLHDYLSRGHKNYVSLLGVINTLLTGGLALMSLHGIWFAVKEASLPFLLGLIVFLSAFTRNPAARMMFWNPNVLRVEDIERELNARGNVSAFTNLLRRTTLWISFSFMISAILNFVLAYRIFKDIDPALETAVRDQMLNEQIAEMTWMGYAVIALPLFGFSAVLLYLFLKRISGMTGIPVMSLLKS